MAYAKSSIDLDNIENLFTTFEMASLIGRLGGLSDEEVKNLPSHLRFVIMRTLEHSIKHPIFEGDSVIRSPYPYDYFCELLMELRNVQEAAPIAVISFNYDLCLEYAFAVGGVEPDYGLTPRSRLRHGSIRLYKVHGSLNWARDQQTGQIEAASVRPLLTKTYWDRLGLNRDARRPIDTMELLHGPSRWGEAILPQPVIVPPTWNKGLYQEMLKSVWREASKALAGAENIFVIGYSLPMSDHFFRSFYTLSTISDSIIERFWVFDPADSSEVTDRFRSLLGPAILNRAKFRHDHLPFKQAIVRLAETFGLRHNGIDDE